LFAEEKLYTRKAEDLSTTRNSDYWAWREQRWYLKFGEIKERS